MKNKGMSKYSRNFKKMYGIGKTTELKFKKIFGLNLKYTKKKQTSLNNIYITAFAKKNVKRAKGKRLFKRIKRNIKFHKNKIKTYRGMRHIRKYPVRGQRTHTNATYKK